MPIRKLVLALLAVLGGTALTPAAPGGFAVIQGSFETNRQPDGNTVVFDAPDGLVVLDTGRHPEHSQKILEFATQAGRPIVAVMNSHWHLDHVSGNPRLRARYPALKVYASNAIDGAMHGFLANSKQQASALLDSADFPEGMKAEIRTDIATKGGLVRPGPDRWVPDGRPEYLIECCKASMKRLGVERIDLWQLHRIDAKVPRDEQFGAVRRLLDEGYIHFAGLSEVSVAEVDAAARVFPVASVQNRYNYEDRGSEDVLEYCTQRGIGFIPWYPLSAGALTRDTGELAQIAKDQGVTRGQAALAWLLARSPVLLAIPGTSRVAHLEENAAAAAIRLR
jgi:hypothetical protein